MPVDLGELLAPSHTAVLTMELQRGVVGDLSPLPALAAEVEQAGVVEATGRLLAAARSAGARVVHCTAEFRADRLGSGTNAPLLAAMARHEAHLLVGSPAVELMPALGPDDGDLICPRRHGVSPFTGTSLDATLRNLGVRTVVATGVSTNLGVLGLCLEAVNLGYSVVLPTDAVAGFPADYAAQVVEHTLSLLAPLTTVDEVIQRWE